MHSLQAYLDKRTSDELRGMLLAYCEGYADFGVETAMQICITIADRDPKCCDPKAEFLRLCRMYTK